MMKKVLKLIGLLIGAVLLFYAGVIAVGTYQSHYGKLVTGQTAIRPAKQHPLASPDQVVEDRSGPKGYLVNVWVPGCYFSESDLGVFQSMYQRKDWGFVSLSNTTEDQPPFPDGISYSVYQPQEELSVWSYPTTVLFDSSGREIKRHIGAFGSEEALGAFLATAL